MSYNKSIFDFVPKKIKNLTRFNLSHEWKASLRPGDLVPCLIIECMPSDFFTKIRTEFMFRFQSLYYPIMCLMTMRCDYFWIPFRILWPDRSPEGDSGWTSWISQKEDAENEFGPPVMTLDMKYFNNTFLNYVAAYFGVPILKEETGFNTLIQLMSAFPLSAYLKIWDWFYRNPQLESEKWFPLISGINDTFFHEAFHGPEPPEFYRYLCLSTKWEKDYFTSARPTPQLGDAIQVPMIANPPGEPGGYPTQWIKLATGAEADNGGIYYDPATNHSTDEGGTGIGLDIQTTAASMQQLREAEILQQYYYRLLQIGSSNYDNFLEGMYAANPRPGIIDSPVMFGSTFGRVQISDTMTQANTSLDGQNYQTGDYAGNANLYNNGESMSYKCEEHGLIIAILQVNANTSYGQGIARFWRRYVQTDYPLDMFSSIGDQEIRKEEIMYWNKTGEETKNEGTFGYQDRHGEMKYINNIHVGMLNWDNGLSKHLGRQWVSIANGTEYDETFEIGEEFISAQPLGEEHGHLRLTDVFKTLPGPNAGDSVQGIIDAHLFHTVIVNRPLPLHSIPKIG